MQQCFLPRPITPRTPFLDQAGNPTCFTLSGDPVAGTGDIDAGQSDRRILLTSGPFQMALGDTNEVVIATMAAIGSDRLSSVSVLKFVDRFAQEAFDNLFELPSPPAPPNVVASELDGAIFLNWSGNAAAVAATENHNDLGHVFEGYNIFQLPSAGASASAGIRLATEDISNGITTISQEKFDISSGQVLNLPVQFGNNTGLSRVFTITADALRSLNLVNGQTYYFGVSAYSSNTNPAATTKTLESVLTVVTVVPETTKPGVTLQSAPGDGIATEHTGPSDGAVQVTILDATAVTGADYTVTFTDSVDAADTTGATTLPVWHLRNTTSGEFLFRNQLNQSGDDDYLVKEGIQVKVFGAPADWKSFQIVQNAAGAIDPPGAAGLAFQGFPTPGAANPDAAHQASGQRWALHTGDNGSRGSYAAFISRSMRGDNFSRVVPFDWEMRFTGESWAVKAFTSGAILKVPFEYWNIGINTPNDTSDDYRLIPWFLDADGFGLSYGLGPIDHAGSGGDNDPFTQWVYWRIPAEHTDNSPGTAGYDNYVTALDTLDETYYGTYGFGGAEAIARSVLLCWNCDDVSDGTLDPAVERIPEAGTVFRFISTKPNSSSDTFTFSTAGSEPSSSQAQAKEDVLELVNVFPNPYLGVNNFEGNRFNRFMTFNHLPERATIRIFSLAGVLVRTIEKDDASQYTNWDLLNEENLPVASGLYIANIEMPDLGVSKNLKLAIIQEQQFLRRF